MTYPSVTAVRAEADRCPGVLRPHRAADGALLRLRVPGGRVTAAALGIISAASVRFADGDVQLTSRGNLQLRGVATDDLGAVLPTLVDEVARAGLLPHPSHERVRNIVCSPLTGLLGGVADLRPLIAELDQRLCSATDLAGLPGRFLFVLDDGRGDVGGPGADLGVLAVNGRSIQIRVGDLADGPVVVLDQAADVLVDLARRFLGFARELDRGEAVGQGWLPGRRPAWHVRELPRRGLELWDGVGPVAPSRRTPDPIRFGPLVQDDGRTAVSTLVPLGLLAPGQVEALVTAADIGTGQLIVTPWRGVVVPDLPASGARAVTDRFAAVGLGVDDESPWRGITACTGAPRCAHGQGDTRSLAASIARSRTAERASVDALPVHIIGCDRRCGSPAGRHVEVLTGRDGVEVRGGAAPITVPTAAAPAAVDTALRASAPAGGDR